jgi:hypothetical protein
MSKKICFVLIIIVALFIITGCEQSKPPITLSPPSWIQGEWNVDEANLNDDQCDFIYFQFTTNNISMKTQFTEFPGSQVGTTSFADAYKTGTVKEYYPNNQYIIDIYFRNQHLKYDFTQTSDTTLAFSYSLNTDEDTRFCNFNKR